MRSIDSTRAAAVVVLSFACACGGGGGGGGGNNPPVAAITDPAASAAAFVGAATSFTGTCTDPDGDSVTGTWAMPGSDQTSATGLGPLYVTYTAVGSYQVTLTCKDSKGATGTATRDVTIDTPTAVALRAEAPARIRAGSLWGAGVVVYAVNGSDMAVPEAGVPITVAVQGVTGGISGTVTVNTDASGAAVFPDAAFTDAAAGGTRTLTFTSPTLTATSADVEVRTTGGYNITLRWIAGDTLARRQAFDQARLRWETVIAADVQDFTLSQSAGVGCDNRLVSEKVDDLLIFVNVAYIDGPGEILGSAGPCLLRPTGPNRPLPLVGQMKFDSADMNSLESAGTLRAVVMHEMAHVLGFGTIWDQSPLALLVGKNTADPYFNGTNANAHFDTDNDGASYTAGTHVPVEDSGGEGTAWGHWRESAFGRELMTGWLSGTTQPMSATTIASLQDMGYSVDYEVADAFDIASAALRAPEVGPVFDLTNDFLPAPAQFVDGSAQAAP